MNWQLTLRNFGIIAAKNAVNALLVNTGAWFILPANFNLSNHDAVWNVVKLAAVTIGSREAAVFVPKILKWSQSE
jgi:hypothetical protein